MWVTSVLGSSSFSYMKSPQLTASKLSLLQLSVYGHKVSSRLFPHHSLCARHASLLPVHYTAQASFSLGALAFVLVRCCHVCEFSPQIAVSLGTGACLQLSELGGIMSVGLNISSCLETASWAAWRRNGAVLQGFLPLLVKSVFTPG